MGLKVGLFRLSVGLLLLCFFVRPSFAEHSPGFDAALGELQQVASRVVHRSSPRLESSVDTRSYFVTLRKTLSLAQNSGEIILALRLVPQGNLLDKTEDYLTERGKIFDEQSKRFSTASPSSKDTMEMVRLRSQIGVRQKWLLEKARPRQRRHLQKALATTNEKLKADVARFLATEPNARKIEELSRNAFIHVELETQIQHRDIRRKLASMVKKENAVNVDLRPEKDRLQNHKGPPFRYFRKESAKPGFIDSYFATLAKALALATSPEEIAALIATEPDRESLKQKVYYVYVSHERPERPLAPNVAYNYEEQDRYDKERRAFLDKYLDGLRAQGKLRPEIVAAMIRTRSWFDPYFQEAKLKEYSRAFWKSGPTPAQWRALLHDTRADVGQYLVKLEPAWHPRYSLRAAVETVTHPVSAACRWATLDPWADR